MRILKRASRILLSKFLGRSINHALVPAEEAERLSFDVFDTLIVRTCRPDDVFALTQRKYNALHDEHIEFKEDRLKAERTARRKNIREDVTLDEIYGELNYSHAQKEELKNLEIESELEVVRPNPELEDFYSLMMSRGKRIIVVSDMYLPAEIIGDILNRCGYSGYESLYVSSEYGLSKRRGGLFSRVLSDEGVSPGKILHVGDHAVSDYIMPRRQGMKSFLYRAKKL